MPPSAGKQGRGTIAKSRGPKHQASSAAGEKGLRRQVPGKGGPKECHGVTWETLSKHTFLLQAGPGTEPGPGE